MTETKHTPGPWCVSGVRRKWQAPGRKNLNDAHAILAGPDEETTALVLYDPDQHSVCWADARLIASAPALLEALTAILHTYDDGGTPLGKAFKMANAAILKATGHE